MINIFAEANSIDPMEHTSSIFGDLSKAFDVINNKILLNILNYYGLRGILIICLQDYSIMLYAEIDKSKSTLCSWKCAVPQGSIIGPLLWLI